jgi:hypothetical protein
VQRRYADGALTGYPKTERSRRRVPLTTHAFEAIESLPPRLDKPLLFPAPAGAYLSLDNWRTRDVVSVDHCVLESGNSLGRSAVIALLRPRPLYDRDSTTPYRANS